MRTAEVPKVDIRGRPLKIGQTVARIFWLRKGTEPKFIGRSIIAGFDRDLVELYTGGHCLSTALPSELLIVENKDD